MAEMRAQNLASALELLTPQQREKFAKMKGAKIDMDLSKF